MDIVFEMEINKKLKLELLRTAKAFPWLPQFNLSNSNARIKQVKTRIKELEKRANIEESKPIIIVFSSSLIATIVVLLCVPISRPT